MLSDPVAEAFGLIHRHPSGENLLATPLPEMMNQTCKKYGSDNSKDKKNSNET